MIHGKTRPALPWLAVAFSFGLSLALVMHLVWGVPKMEQELDDMELLRLANAVQMTTLQHYALVPVQDVSEIDLDRPFVDPSLIQRFAQLASKHQIHTTTGYPDGSFGQALALSHLVFEGKDSPKLYSLDDLKNTLELSFV